MSRTKIALNVAGQRRYSRPAARPEAKNVFMVDVFQGSSGQLQQEAANVSAEITQGRAITPIPVSGLGDKATAYQITTEVFDGASIFVLKGTEAIYLVDEATGSQAPTTAALAATARTALGRMP